MTNGADHHGATISPREAFLARIFSCARFRWTVRRGRRSWGFPVWLASQDADAFLTKGANATDFAELAECGSISLRKR